MRSPNQSSSAFLMALLPAPPTAPTAPPPPPTGPPGMPTPPGRSVDPFMGAACPSTPPCGWGECARWAAGRQCRDWEGTRSLGLYCDHPRPLRDVHYLRRSIVLLVIGLSAMRTRTLTHHGGAARPVMLFLFDSVEVLHNFQRPWLLRHESPPISSSSQMVTLKFSWS